MPSFNTIPPSNIEYTKDGEYTTESGLQYPLSESLAGLNLESTSLPLLNVIPEPEVHVKTIDRNTQEETLDPSMLKKRPGGY